MVALYVFVGFVILAAFLFVFAILKAGSDADDVAEANPRANDYNESWDM